MLSHEFFADFKLATETRWRDQAVNPRLYGFQFQPDTYWNPGLTRDQIATYEAALGIRFPYDFRAFLSFMNGTGLPTINVNASSVDSPRYSVGVYSYPKDLELVRDEIKRLANTVDFQVLQSTLAEEGFDLPEQAKFVPIYAHRSVVCTPDQISSAVLSIWDESDVIVYGQSLEQYLVAEFLREPRRFAEFDQLRESVDEAEIPNGPDEAAS